MRKNNMRSPEEKEKIVKRYLNGESIIKLSKEYNLDRKRIYIWIKKYEKSGIEGLKSQTGKASYKNPHAGLHLRKPKNRIE